MRLFTLWLFILPTIRAHNFEVNDLKCLTSEKRSAELEKCECHGRYVSFHVNFLRTLENFKFKIETYQLKDGKFTRIFKFPPIAWCEFTSGKAKLLNFQKLVINGIRRSAPAFFHKCPYVGLHRSDNTTFSNDVVAIFPLGDFQMVATFMDKEDSKILALNISFSVTD